MIHRLTPVLLTIIVLAALGSLCLLCGCDSPSEPEFDWTGLLTDEELRTEEDPDAPEENPDWADWVEANNIPVRSLKAENYSDLLALRPYLKDKRIVQLGENGHGAAEFNALKVRLVKFLHEVMGFEVLAFESSIFECYRTDAGVSSQSPIEMMGNSIADVWHTKEVLPLFEYLKHASGTDRPLHIAGLDTRITSPSAAAYRPDFFRQILQVLDTDFADHVFRLDAELIERRLDEQYIRDNRDSLVNEYETVAELIDLNEARIAAAFPELPETAVISRQVALSIARRIDELYREALGELDRAFEIRDKAMAENLAFLLEELHPHAKIIVWAHNAHLCHDYQSIPERGLKSMGWWISGLYRPDLYTVGFYMYRGSAATNDREVIEVPEAETGSLESILYRTRRKHCFVEMRGQSPVQGNSWMFQRIQVNEWDTGTLSMAPANQYDGIVFVDTVSPPDYAPGR